ncbi:hypothetical protein RJD24_12335 [Bacillaceae bacterium IKA-2]|nr:hypothetical protein RJD24_12335 [Bacillaceae bacterium IKA-2]
MTNKINYLESLQFKLKSAEYHNKKGKESLHKYGLFEKEEDGMVALSSELTAMMLTLHSLLDILAQYINEKREMGLPSEKLYFTWLFNNQDKIIDLLPLLNKLREQSEYITDYCNYSKHQNLIALSDYWTFLTTCQPTKYHIITPFKKGTREHTAKHVTELIYKDYESFTSVLEDLIEIV